MKDSCPWLEHVGFEIFCEGLLPYRIAPRTLGLLARTAGQHFCRQCMIMRNNIMTIGRQSSYTMTMFIQRSHEFRNNYTIKDKRLSALWLPFPAKKTNSPLSALRDLGIPVTMDYNPSEAVPTSNRRWSTPFDPRLFTKSYYEITQMGSGEVLPADVCP